MKQWYKSKTIWFNVLAVVAVALEANVGLLRDVLGHQHYAIYATFIAIGNGLLRLKTSKAINTAIL